MLWFFFFGFFLVVLSLYKMGVLQFNSATIHLDDQTHILSTSIPSSSSSSSCSLSFNYDVFLSFRGEDTRKTFVDHLYSALDQRLIHTYKDDITLPRGESVGPAMLKAIEESRYAVVIFSKNYADSSWCLDELVHIMKCRADNGQIVIPVFYDVDPSDVKKQKGEFGKAFLKQQMKNLNKGKSWRNLFAKQEVDYTPKIESWKKALVDASNISGWEPKNVANGHEATVIKKIVDTIFNTLFPLDCDDEKLVGMRSRLKGLISQLETWSNGVRMVGIWGVGGGGKTTLATSVCKEISHLFEGHCILENIREKASKNGLQKLQEDILSNVFRKRVKVHSVAEGKRTMKSMLCHRKVLLILDDVDNLDQLEALAGSHTWVGDGSRIIITTRDEHLLRTHRVDDIYPVTLLSHEEAICLFNIHAYNEKKQVKDYGKLSSRVVFYAAGLPLALKVLGSFLYDKDEKEWMGTLDRLKDIPQSKILKQLKISYDGLESKEKELFLDIACFFRGHFKHDPMEILEACGFYPDIGIKVLRQKALITIDSKGKFDMHDLIQEMGHFIIRGEHPDNPEKHSRVWKNEDIRNMCFGDPTKENDKIEAMGYNQRPDMVQSHFFKFVSNLKKLRWIHVFTIDHKYAEGPNFLSNELRYIKWQNYPESPFPDSFQPMNLVVLKMHTSIQRELWRGHKLLPQLKVLQLNFMMKLVSTPNFDGLPSLQKLELRGCFNLEEIHPSIGNHRSLKDVQVSGCLNLGMFPTIFKMEKLELLIIYSRQKSSEFLDIQANMKGLVQLSLDGILIEGLLTSIGERCTSLISLHLINCSIIKRIEVDFNGLKHLKDFRIHGNIPLKVCHLTLGLQRLDLVGCCLEDEEIPSAIGEMSNLQELNLEGNNFSNLHVNISQLTRLKLLNLSYCKRLLKLPQLPSSITVLLANKCDSLTDVGDFYLDYKRLRHVSLICSNMIIDMNIFLQSMLEGENAGNHCVTLLFQGLEIPKGFTSCLRYGSYCTLQLPENWRRDFCGFLMCAVLRNDYECKLNQRIGLRGSLSMDSEDDYVIWKEGVGDGIIWMCYIPFASLRHTQWWDSTYKKVLFSFGFLDKRINLCNALGVRLVDRKGGSGPMITLSDISTNNSSGISDGNDDYTPNEIVIEYDSNNYLEISPHIYEWKM